MFLQAGQKIMASIKPVDAFGNVAKVDGAPIWEITDSNIVNIAPSEDGFECEVISTGHVGKVQLSVRADADLGEGVTGLLGVLDVEVVAGQAVGLQISVSAPIAE